MRKQYILQIVVDTEEDHIASQVNINTWMVVRAQVKRLRQIANPNLTVVIAMQKDGEECVRSF